MNYGVLIGAIAVLAWAGLAIGQQAGPGGAPAPQEKPPDARTLATLQEALERTAREVKELKEEHARELERQRKQAELQQKQIEVLERTARLLADQLKKQAPAAASVDELESQTSVLGARVRQAAQRDQELADATSDLREQLDAQGRKNQLPYTARELFLPTQTNETPLAIYGQLLWSYSKQNGQTGLFDSPSIGPWLLLQLNNRFLFSANFDIDPSGVSLGQGQMDWYITNWLTLTAGRFLTPIGTFNERISPEWINKLPDIPIMFYQVLPQTSTDGLQLRGSRYLGGLPFKVEYAAFLGNGFQLAQAPTNRTMVADLEGITGGPDSNNSKAYGGRIGLWAPLQGLNFGLSGYTNGIWSPGSQNHYYLWDFDANYHMGSWDFRLELANTFQEATSFQPNNINRRGLYTQIAYRDYRAKHWFFQNLEYVLRYSMADFHGINAAKLDQTAFATPYDIPVSRNQYTLGINYYFYPSMIFKLAYEINRERGLNLHDDIFLAQGVWAF